MDCFSNFKYLLILICLSLASTACTAFGEEGARSKVNPEPATGPTIGKTTATAVPAANQLVAAVQYHLLSWNVESDGATSKVICEQLAELNQNDHYDIFTLSEVLPADLKKFRYALGKHYKYVYSKSGFSDRLEILYNENKFELVRHFEIKEINILNRYRAPLVAHLKDRANGTEFLVMVNHLARGKAEIRQKQATMLVDWARDQTLPVFALGDYNFDFVFKTRKGNPAFSNMLKDNIWRWVEPVELIDTNWYDNPRNPDGIDDYPGSILDFAFVAASAKNWKSTCRVLVREGDFPDDKTTSDHRPFEMTIVKP
jgi:endonuclease/exonuclease/phosphatase family metal-dependent hydrolase